MPGDQDHIEYWEPLRKPKSQGSSPAGALLADLKRLAEGWKDEWHNRSREAAMMRLSARSARDRYRLALAEYKAAKSAND